MSKHLKVLINLWRLVLPVVLYKTCEYKDLIDADLKRNGDSGLLLTLIDNKAFRNVFYYRTTEQKILSALSKIFLEPLESVEIHLSPKKIGGGESVA